MKLKYLLFILVLALLIFIPDRIFAQTGVEVTKALGQAGDGFSFMSLLRGLLGLIVLLGICFLFSTNRRAISWRVVIFGLLFQLVLAIAVLKVPAIQYIIEFIARIFIKILDSSNAGSAFLFKSLVTNKVEVGMITFAFQILPTIIFFSALTSVLFYYGIIQKVVYGMAWLLTKVLKISGAEGLVASSNVFLGQTEAPFLIKEYLPKMNKSEIMLVMVAGMATMAGGVLAIYIGLLGGDDPVGKMLFAKHLITASVMAAPAAVVTSKILVPQTEPIESDIKITKDKIGSNILDAIANGTGSGLKLAVNVAAMLIAFIALIYFINFTLGKIGDWTQLNTAVANLTGGLYTKFSLQFLLGYALAPLTWLMGVNAHDMTLVGQLLGEKIILNEMIGYASLKNLIATGAFYDQKSIILAVYVLCGFANFSSVGIQIGGISAIAPNQRKTLSGLGFRALLGGGMVALISATIVAMILG
jgi:CNT family concentrative nucleoside transporter